MIQKRKLAQKGDVRCKHQNFESWHDWKLNDNFDKAEEVGGWVCMCRGRGRCTLVTTAVLGHDETRIFSFLSTTERACCL